MIARPDESVSQPDTHSRPNARLYLFGQVPFGTGGLAGMGRAGERPGRAGVIRAG